MIELKLITANEVTQFFLNDPKLCLMGLDDSTLEALYKTKQFTSLYNSYYSGLYQDNELIAILKEESCSPIVVNIHLYLKTKYQATHTLDDIAKYMIDYYYNNTLVYKLMIMCPSICRYVIRACKRYGFVLEGNIKKACPWRGEIYDLLIYTLIIRE